MKTFEETPETTSALPRTETLPVPSAPQSMEETGLSDSQVTALLLKTLYQHGTLLGSELAERTCLPFVVLDDLLLSATQRHFVEVLGTSGHSRAGYRFELTDEGRSRAEAALAASRYVGPAPVPLVQFKEWVDTADREEGEGLQAASRQAFGDLVLPDEIMDALGPAVNSGASIFLHGAPGNGKTAIAERLGALISSEVYLPYSIIVDGHIIVVFDPVYHHADGGPSEAPWRDSGSGQEDFSTDRRFVKDPAPHRVRRWRAFHGPARPPAQ